jgi:hypothetical protein
VYRFVSIETARRVNSEFKPAKDKFDNDWSAKTRIVFPAIIALGIPHILQTVDLPRLVVSLSWTSSCISEKLWINSRDTAAGIADFHVPWVISQANRQSADRSDLP